MDSFDAQHQQQIADQIKHIEELLKDTPEDPWLGLELGRLHLMAERPDHAESIVQEILSRPSTEHDLEVKAACLDGLGQMALFKGDAREAIKRLTRARDLRQGLNEPQLLGQTCYNLAIAHWMSGELQHAVELLERAAALFPDWPLVHDAMVKVYDQMGLVEKREESVAKLAAIQAEVLERVSMAERELPLDESQFHFARGLTLELAQDYESAVREFQEAIDGGLVNSEAYRRLGICLSELERYSEAVAALRESIEQDSTNHLSHADLGYVYQKLRMRQQAAKEYERTVELAPEFIEVYPSLIDMYLQLGRADLARIWSEKAIEIDDTDARVYWLLGRASLEHRDILSCYNAWQRAAELAREDELRETVESELDDLMQSLAPSTLEQRAAALEVLSAFTQLQESEKAASLIACLEEICRIDPFFMEAQMDLAQAYLDAGMSDKASVLFDQIVQKKPDNQDAYLGLGTALLELGRLSDAQHALSHANALDRQTEAGRIARVHLTKLKVRNQYGDLPVQRFEEAESYYEQGELEKAIRVLTEAVSLAPDVGLFHYELGWMFLSSNRLNSAVRQFRQALRAEPMEGRFHGGLGMALLRQHKIQEAVPFLQQAIALDPTEPESHNALGGCYAALGRHTLAEQEFRRVTELDPNRTDGWINLCRCLLYQDKYGHVEAELQRIAEVVPDLEFAEDIKGLVGTLSEAKHQMVESLEGHEMLSETTLTRLSSAIVELCNEGRALESAGYVEAAIQRYHEAVAESFEAFDPHFLLGNSYARLGQHERAIEEYSLAVSMQASDPEMADAYYNLGNSYRDLDKHDRAISAYEKAIEIYPEIRDARGNIAACLAAQKQYTQAIEMMHEEVRCHPDKERSGSVHFSMGLWLFQAGKEIEALFELRKAKLLGAKLGMLHGLTGIILASRGHWNLAESEFQAALEISPDLAWVGSAMRACRYSEYEVPRLLTSEDPRVKHSLEWQGEQVRRSYPDLSERIEIIDLGQGKHVEYRR